MHLILTGATGLVGSGVLDAMLKMKEVTKISIISRRPVKMAEDAKDSRVNVIIHRDFEQYDKNLLDQLRGATGCVWALGISQNSVSSKEEYVKITKDFALAAAKAFQTIPPAAEEGGKEEEQPFHFVYVSGAGTTLKPGRLTPLFARVKGETELALAEMRRANPRFRADTVRPGFIDAAGHEAILPYIPAHGLGYRALLALTGPVIRTAYRGGWSPTPALGRFLTEMAMGRWEGKLTGPEFETLPGGFTVVENPGFRRLAGLS